MILDSPSVVVVEGGTHNEFAPPFEFLEKTFLPLVNRMGPRIKLTLERFGFYPAGGGELRAEIQPAACLKAFDITERGEFIRRSITARVAGLSLSIAEREMDVIRRGLDWDESVHRWTCGDSCLSRLSAMALPVAAPAALPARVSNGFV